MSDYQQTLQRIAAALGHTFQDSDLLLDALTHSSFRNEKLAVVRSDNERLEFLGDAILNFVAGEALFERFPQAREGQLSRLRAPRQATSDLRCGSGWRSYLA